MRLRFKRQQFQQDAAKAVTDAFKGQPYSQPKYLIDRGTAQKRLDEDDYYTGFRNAPIIPELTDERILNNIRGIQRKNGIKPSEELLGRYNLTIEMETGVGKTYTYIKTMYELWKAYGWNKYIVVVPGVAVREGVYKTFEITREHFKREYGKNIHCFIYDSSRLADISGFASDSGINAMIINSQAFNSRGKDARRISMELDSFQSRRPIDVIAKTNPILIIDEPQSVEGEATKEKLKEFNPLFTLRYSATHKKDSIYNMVYRLDAMEAYNKKLVKKIAVKGISKTGDSSGEGYVYVESINPDKSEAVIRFDQKQKYGVKKVNRKVKKGDNLFELSGGLNEYKEGFTVANVAVGDTCVDFTNGLKLYAGDVNGDLSQEQLRRIQIRETVLTHIERERELFNKGIKVLSLFFIDEVANYKIYEDGQPKNGTYADIFEEEYKDIIDNFQIRFGEEKYLEYLKQIPADKTHAGYFSVDGKGNMINPKLSGRGKEKTSEDVSAYDLIMKNKELLLDQNPKKSPVRFIFSHSALREGWDNPNVFQICTLKQSSSDIRKRQEVGRGLRLCVNQAGERMDINVLGRDVQNVNLLTVIASESYDSFTRALQTELAEDVATRPRKVNAELFIGKIAVNEEGGEIEIGRDIADAIIYDLIKNDYIDKNGTLTDKYYQDKSDDQIILSIETNGIAKSVVDILDCVYSDKLMLPEDARQNVRLRLNEENLYKPEFQALWNKINAKTVYAVDFDPEQLTANAIGSINRELRVQKPEFVITTGVMEDIESKDELKSGESFEVTEKRRKSASAGAYSQVKYDIVGKLAESTALTRKDIVRILTGIESAVFDQFKLNPEEFILKAASLINIQKATAVIEHITYSKTEQKYDNEIFADPTVRGRLNENVMDAKKSVYNKVIYDSQNEKKFAKELEVSPEVAVYVKLPNDFFIYTPMGKYNPDWAIAFYEGTVKHIYFVAETKGSLDSLQLREIEDAKINCAKKHFAAISNDNVVYDVVDGYDKLWELVNE